MDSDERTLFIGNINNNVTKDMLEEIFIQVGPLYNVNLVEKPNGNFGFIEFADECSVLYACKMMQDLKLFGRPVTVKPRGKTRNSYEWEKLNGRGERDNGRHNDRPIHTNVRRTFERSGHHQDTYLTPPPMAPITIPGRHQNTSWNQNQQHYGSHERLHSYTQNSWRTENDSHPRRHSDRDDRDNGGSSSTYRKTYQRNR